MIDDGVMKGTYVETNDNTLKVKRTIAISGLSI